MENSDRIATKIRKMRPSLTLSLKALVEERQAQSLPVYDFGLGETKGTLDPRIGDAGAAAFKAGDTMYPDPAGIPSLRRQVLKWLDLEAHYDIENVVVSTGAKQCLFNIFLALCNPGDIVLLEAAPWVSYEPLALAASAVPVLVIPKSSPRLKVTPADLERNLRRRPYTRFFLLNNPCNPTAQLYDEDEVNALLDVCIEHQVYFVLDRLYWRILFDGRTYGTPRINDETKPWIIQVDGLSKNWRRTGGIRIGWSVAPTDVAKGMTSLQSHYTSGPAVPAQQAALAAVTPPYAEEMVRRLEEKRDLMIKGIASVPHVDPWPTPATFYSFWDVTKAIGMRTPDGVVLDGSDAIARYLVQKAGVVTASGSGFFQDGYLRLSFATPDKHIEEGMKAAADAMSALTP